MLVINTSNLFILIEQILNEFRLEVEYLRSIGLHKYLDNNEVLKASTALINSAIKIVIPDEYIADITNEYILVNRNTIPISIDIDEINGFTELSFDILTKRWQYVKSVELFIRDTLLWYDYVLGMIKRFRARRVSKLFEFDSVPLPFDIVYEGYDDKFLYLTLIFHEQKLSQNCFTIFDDRIINVDITDLLKDFSRSNVIRKESIDNGINRRLTITVDMQNENNANRFLRNVENTLESFIVNRLDSIFEGYDFYIINLFPDIIIDIEVCESIFLRCAIDFDTKCEN
jgi:hypothetical protein